MKKLKKKLPLWQDNVRWEKLRKNLTAEKEIEPLLPKTEPNWKDLANTLKIPDQNKKDFIQACMLLWLLPFANKPLILNLLTFKHRDLPEFRLAYKIQENEDRLKLCALFEILLTMALQGNSAFPKNPDHLAQQVQLVIQDPSASIKSFIPLADLFLTSKTHEWRQGFNDIEMEDLEALIESEYRRLAGKTEEVYRAGNKLQEYQAWLRRNPAFKQDWEMLKANFQLDRYCDSKGIIRRSALPERNWQRRVNPPDLRLHEDQFELVFNFFCWKWCLYGMDGERPMVEKLTYTFTPYGTQVFIPAYWSFDRDRDLNWKVFKRLHAARGVPRQGQKLAERRQEEDATLLALFQADEAARSARLKPVKRMDLLIKQAGLPYDIDEGQLNRMVRKARRRFR